MRRGPAPVSRDAVRHAIEQAGAAGITGEELAQLLPGMTLNHIKAQVYRLRAYHGMPLVSCRGAGEPGRYWASAALMAAAPARPEVPKPQPAIKVKPVKPAPPQVQRKATRTQRILDWLASNPGGGVPQQIGAGIGMEAKAVSSLLSNIVGDGRAVTRPAPQGKAVRLLRYFAPQHAPAPEPRPTALEAGAARAPAGRNLKPLSPASFASGEVDYSRAVVTVCPAGVDHRFTFTPPPGWRGAITRDWQERRLQEQHHGR